MTKAELIVSSHLSLGTISLLLKETRKTLTDLHYAKVFLIDRIENHVAIMVADVEEDLMAIVKAKEPEPEQEGGQT